MKIPDQQFWHELEIFRTEAEAAAQFFYAERAVHEVAANDKFVYRFLNKSPLFWNTCLGALQTATFMALGRVFDQGSPHNIYRVLRIAQDNPEIFSKAALGLRKQANSSNQPDWLAKFLHDAYEPKPKDFRRLRAYILKRRRIYESKFEGVRHKFFAHKAASDEAEIAALFGKIKVSELQQLVAFLLSLHEALWQLFINGRKPVLRPSRYSIKRMRAIPSPGGQQRAVQEEITHEVERLLVSASRTTRRRL